MAAAGYSATPLTRKLSLADGQRVWRRNMPRSVAAEIDGAGLALTLLDGPKPPLDVAHVFTTLRAELADELTHLRPLLAPTGMIWVSWPKKAAKVPTDITEDVVRELAFPHQLVDVKVCAVDAVWSGLKLMIRREAR